MGLSPSPSSPSDLVSSRLDFSRLASLTRTRTRTRCLCFFSRQCPKTAPTSSPSSPLHLQHPCRPRFPPPLQLFRGLSSLFFSPSLSLSLSPWLLGCPHPWLATKQAMGLSRFVLVHRKRQPSCIRPGPLSPAKRLHKHQSWLRGAAIGGAWPVLAERGKPSVHGPRAPEQSRAANTSQFLIASTGRHDAGLD